MILTNDIIKLNLQEYSNKNTKICREVKNGNLIKIINGLYETNPNVNGYFCFSLSVEDQIYQCSEVF